MFEPVNDLEKSLFDAATRPSARPQFYRDLLEADIYIVNRGESDPGIQDHTYQPGSDLAIQRIKKDGALWLPVFSSLPRLQQFANSDSNYLRIGARDFFEMTRGANIVLNPNFEYGKEFLPQEIEQMLDGSIFAPGQTTIVPKDTQVLIGQPAVFPNELVKALSDYFATIPLVNRAYLAQYHDPQNDEKPHLLIGIDAKSDWGKIIGDAGMIASNVMGKGELVDFLRLDDSGISQYLVNKTRPFYEKSFRS
jgi:SseB protein C-terminal domain/SseB protein N-terminal domain